MYKHTGMVQTTGGGRTFFEVLSNLAVERGQVREHFSWLHTDVARETVYFNLNNTDHEIAKITPDEIRNPQERRQCGRYHPGRLAET